MKNLASSVVLSFGLSVGIFASAHAEPLNLYATSLGQFRAVDVNSLGHVIGTYQGRDYLLTSENYTALGNFSATSINRRDEILGTIDGKPAIWKAGKTTLLTPSNDSGRYFYLRAFNDSGVAVGEVYTYNGSYAVKYENGMLTTLGSGAAFSINNSGDIVGTDNLSDAGSNAILWKNGQQITLRRPSYCDGFCSASNWVARDISNSGAILGHDNFGAWVYQNETYLPVPTNVSLVSTANNIAVGFIYSPSNYMGGAVFVDGTTYDVNGLIANSIGMHITQISQVTDSGYMLASSNQWTSVVLSNSATNYVLPTSPVPEPTSGALLLAGLAFFGLITLRKRRA